MKEITENAIKSWWWPRETTCSASCSWTWSIVPQFQTLHLMNFECSSHFKGCAIQRLLRGTILVISYVHWCITRTWLSIRELVQSEMEKVMLALPANPGCGPDTYQAAWNMHKWATQKLQQDRAWRRWAHICWPIGIHQRSPDNWQQFFMNDNAMAWQGRAWLLDHTYSHDIYVYIHI